MSVSLVFDESGSMASGNPSGIQGEKAAGHAFVDMMDGVIDEAAIIGFDSGVYSLCEMTTLKPVLNSAIDMLAADGRLAGQPYLVRLVADARREEPEATFTELAERLGLHRSAVQRALERIERLALHPDAGVGKRRRGVRQPPR